MNSTDHNDLFKDYYFNNKGTFFKSFNIDINNTHYSYDIYWGDPNIIFDEKDFKETFPLAINIIPNSNNYPNPRIFLHEKLEKNNNQVFEMVIAHEIGHFWLHDILGFNHPMTNNFMNAHESEIWADYFAYNFFKKYRNVSSLDDFMRIFEQVSKLQIAIYNLDPSEYKELTFTKKIEDLRLLIKKNTFAFKDENHLSFQKINAIEITLNALGNIFE